MSHLRKHPDALGVALFVMVLASCVSPRTELFVVVDTNLSWGPGREIESLAVSVRAEGPTGTLRPRQLFQLGTSEPGRISLPGSFGVLREVGSSTSAVWIEVRGCGRDGCEGFGGAAAPVAVQRVIAPFVTEETRVVPIFLTTACEATPCVDPLLRCDALLRRCVTARVEANALPTYPADVAFAFPDIGVLDGISVEADATVGDISTDGVTDADSTGDATADRADGSAMDAQDAATDGLTDAMDVQTISDSDQPLGDIFARDVQGGTDAEMDVVLADSSVDSAPFDTPVTDVRGDSGSDVVLCVDPDRTLPSFDGGVVEGGFVQVAIGSQRTCALHADGSVYCWGYNLSGVLLPGTFDNPIRTPTMVTAGASSLSCGSQHCCVRLRTGGARCWGSNQQGVLGDPTTPLSVLGAFGTPRGLAHVAVIGAGQAHSCALANNGSVWCWGVSVSGVLGAAADGATPSRTEIHGVPTLVCGLPAIVDMSTAEASMFVRDVAGGWRSWGSNQYGLLGAGIPPSTGGVDVDGYTASQTVVGANGATEVRCGGSLCCLRMSDGTVRCWGLGRLTGNAGAPATVTSPTTVIGLAAVRQLAVGASFACALFESGGVVCWGDGDQGQLGADVGSYSAVPTPVVGIRDATAIAAGGNTACAIRVDGSIWCWGADDYAQTGDGADTRFSPFPIPVPIAGNVVQVSTRDGHCCARLSSGGIACWGRDDLGQVGPGIAPRSSSAVEPPIAVPGLMAVDEVATGGNHSCARAGSRVYCWGSATSGQIGDGTIASARLTPTPALLTDASRICLGRDTSYALTASGTIRCWGRNDFGQCALPITMSEVTTPTIIPGVDQVTQISAGFDHACARRSDGSVYCWGNNDQGQLGDGTTSRRTVPTRVLMLTDAEEVAAGATHTCARRRDGTVWCWGANEHGQLGTGLAGVAQPSPVAVVLISTATAISVGSGHSCARLFTGVLRCWGQNTQGQCGDGTTQDRYRPVAVSRVSNALGVTAGASHTCSWSSSGAVLCWGNETQGALGAGIYRRTPVRVEGLP